MNTSKKAVIILSSLIVLLSLAAALTALLYKTDGNSFEFVSIRGETVNIRGHGLYRYDSVSAAAQAIAQDVVTLAVGIPLLVVALYLFSRDSLRGKLLLSGTLSYFLYTYTSYAFLSAYNQLFLVYVALYSLSLFALILSLRSIDVAALPLKISARLPRKSISTFLLLISLLLLFLWLGRILPSITGDAVPIGLESYSTLVIQALDLGVIVPVGFLSAVLLLKKNAWGYLLSSIVLIKGFTMLTAITAMIIGQLLVGVRVNVVEMIMFPLFTLVGIFLTVLLYRNVASEETLGSC